MVGSPIKRARQLKARAEKLANPEIIDAEPKVERMPRVTVEALAFGPEPTKRIGRPPKYTPELGEEICNAVAAADYGLEQVCAERSDFPSWRAVYRWLYHPDPSYEPFRQAYARAKEIQGVRQAQLALAEAVNADDPQLGRLRYDARKWMAAKLAPKFFGDKVQHTNAAGDGDATIAIRQENTPLIGELLALMESRRQALSGPPEGEPES